jgi:major membrane immunogen (membrane-anchored lipoprotein)
VVRYILIFTLITLSFFITACKTTESDTTTNDVDYSNTEYNFKKETIIETQYE